MALLKSSGVATGAKLDVTTQNGVVELTGVVRNQENLDQIVKLTKTVPGVTRIDQTLKVAGADEVRQTTAEAPAPVEAAHLPCSLIIRAEEFRSIRCRWQRHRTRLTT